MMQLVVFFFFNDTATTEIYTLSLHDALPILAMRLQSRSCWASRAFSSAMAFSSTLPCVPGVVPGSICGAAPSSLTSSGRSEEHTSELQSRQYLVCRLLLEKKKKQ